MSAWTLGFQIVNFLVLAGLLQRFLFKPVGEMVARRQAEQLRIMSDAALKQEEVEKIRAEVEQARAALVEEGQQLLAVARSEAEHLRDEALQKARKEADAIIEVGKQQVDVEREDVASALTHEAIQIGLGIARRLLEQVTSAHLAESLLLRVCEYIDGLSPERRLALSKELDGAELLVAAAPKLSSAEQNGWLASIAARLGDGVHTRFVEDDSLILGAELRFPRTTVSFCWRDGLRAAEEELVRRADAV